MPLGPSAPPIRTIHVKQHARSPSEILRASNSRPGMSNAVTNAATCSCDAAHGHPRLSSCEGPMVCCIGAGLIQQAMQIARATVCHDWDGGRPPFQEKDQGS
eukprot:2231082-Pleurochrysis_carterae.AAC.3